MTTSTCLRHIYRTISRRSPVIITDRFISTPPIQKPLRFYRTSAISPRITDRFIFSGSIHKPFQFNFYSSYSPSSGNDSDYPSGDFDFLPHSRFNRYLVKLKTLLALPSEHVKHDSVLEIDLEGEISETIHSNSEVLSMPQICDNLFKAMYDPRICVVFLNINTLKCGWAKLDEIRRQILNFRKSGKVIVAFAPKIGVKEYYIASACEEIYAPPRAYVCLCGTTVRKPFIRSVYHSPQYIPEASTPLIVDNIFSNWLDIVSSSTGKKRENVENLVNEGVYRVDKLKEEGFISDVLYVDDIITNLKEKLGVKSLPFVSFREYSRVRKWTVGISRAKELIAIIRVPVIIGSSKKFVENIRRVRASTKFKAVIVRIDCLGGDFRASDSMWQEIRFLAAEKPVIASISDMAAFAGYYIAMGAEAVVAENLSLICSFRPHQTAISTSMTCFRPHDPARSRSMIIDKMDEVEHGKVWTGKDAASRGLVDAIGGLSRAVAIAKLKANIPQNSEVTLVELSRPGPTLPDVLRAIGYSLVGQNQPLYELQQEEKVPGRFGKNSYLMESTKIEYYS